MNTQNLINLRFWVKSWMVQWYLTYFWCYWHFVFSSNHFHLKISDGLRLLHVSLVAQTMRSRISGTPLWRRDSRSTTTCPPHHQTTVTHLNPEIMFLGATTTLSCLISMSNMTSWQCAWIHPHPHHHHPCNPCAICHLPWFYLIINTLIPFSPWPVHPPVSLT